MCFQNTVTSPHAEKSSSMKGFPQIKQLKIPGGGDTAYILLPLLSILSTPTFLFKFTLSSVQILSMRGQEGLPPSGIFT